MRNLLPGFIIEKYLDQEFEGNFRAYSVFIDISGFTSTTEALMKHGKEGAEVLSDILKFLFSTSVESIYSHGGFITRFAGDAFTALFITGIDDPERPRRILTCALTIQKFFQTHHTYHSKFGDFEFAVKVGLSYGDVDWGIVGKDHSKAYYFKGYAVDNCAYAEHHCEKGDICADIQFINAVPELILKKTLKSKKSTSFFRIDQVAAFDTTPNPLPYKNFSEDIVSIFTGKNELHFPAGEFREAFSVFVSFDRVSDLGRFMNVVIEQQEAYGGSHPHLDFGDKGGNILVFFGAPVSYEDNEQRALKFILGVQMYMDSTIQLRAGISQGILYAGYNGVELRQEFTCLGNTVNQSARYMMKANWGEIYTCDRTSKNPSFQFEHKGDFEFKGRSGKIPTYHLIREAEVKQVLYTGKQFGRTEELARLKSMIQPIRNDQFGGIVYVDGLAGIGKSRLIYELKRSLKKSAFTWFEMRCDGILRKSFNPIVYFLEHYFNQSTEYGHAKNKHRFERKLNRIVNRTDQTDIKKELQRSYSFLGHLINLHWEYSLYESLDAKSRYENTMYAFKNLIKAESLQKPVIILVEDCHWIDPDTQTLLQTLFTNVDDFPFLLISACRFNDDDTPFHLGFSVNPENRVGLESLDKDTTFELIKDKFNADRVPLKTLKLVCEKSSGNPFYIEQMVLYLQENKLVDGENNLIATDIDMPSGINSIIVARIDRLTSDLKEIVKTASALGQEFAINILSAMLNNKPLKEYLQKGENETIWYHVTEIDYVFKNALIRDAVYEMQLKKQLRNLHSLAGETMENIYKDQLEMYYSDLANHFENAEVEDKALFYLEKAGNFSRDNYQNTEAITFYNKLLKHFDWVQKFLTNPTGQKPTKDQVEGCQKYIDISLENAKILQLVGKWDEAINICYQLLSLATLIFDDSRFARTELHLGTKLYMKGSYEDAMKHYKSSLDRYEKLKNEHGIARAVANMGLVYWRLGKNDDAMESFERMKKLAENQKDQIGIAKAVGNIGLIYQSQRNYSRAMEFYQKQLKIDEEIGDKLGISVATSLIGTAHYYQGNLDEAMDYFNRRVQLSEELGDKKGISDAIGNIGSIYQKMGNYDKALECSEKQLRLAQELGDKRGIGTSSNYIGDIYRVTGEPRKSIQYFKTGFAISEELGNLRGVANAAGRLGELHTEFMEYDTALDYYDRAIEVSEKLDIMPYYYSMKYQKAELLFLTGRFSDATELNEHVLEKKKELGIPDKIFEGHMLRGRIEFKTGMTGQSNTLYTMLANTQSMSEISDLHYELFKLTEADEHQKPALEFYLKMKDKAPDRPNYELDKRIKVLTKKRGI